MYKISILFTCLVIAYLYYQYRAIGHSKGNQICFFLRLMICSLVILTLAFPIINLPEEKEAYLLLIDSSYSMKIYKSNIESIISQYQVEHEEDDYKIMLFSDKTQLIESKLDDSFANSHMTDLNAAFQDIEQLYSDKRNLKITLVSDGMVTEEIPKSSDIPNCWSIETTPMFGQLKADVAINQIRITARDYRDSKRIKALEIDYDATIEGTASLLIASASQTLYESEIKITKGKHIISMPCDFISSDTLLTGQITLSGDSNPHNNIVSLQSDEDQDITYLIVSSETPGLSRNALETYLKKLQINFKHIKPGQIDQSTLANLSYDGMILHNCSGSDFTDHSIQVIDELISQEGKALFVVAGDHTFALGAYAEHGLETFMPVEDRLSGPEERGNSCLIVVLDTSGSMEDTVFGTKKITMAKSGVQELIQQLHPEDTFGLIAFSDVYEWLQPLTPVKALGALDENFLNVGAKGGTLIKPSLVKAYEAMSKNKANQDKHILLITDGQGEQEGYEDLILQLNRKDISLSCIGIGDDIAADFLSQLSQATDGKFYQVNDIRNLPEFMVRDLYENVKDTLQIGSFNVMSDTSEALQDMGDLNIQQYVATTAKETSKVILKLDNQDPLLVQSQYGIGQVAVLTTQLSSTWSGNLMTSQAASLIAEILKTIPLKINNDDLYIARDGNRLNIRSTNKDMAQLKVLYQGTVLGEFDDSPVDGQSLAVGDRKGLIQVNAFNNDGKLLASKSIRLNYSAEHALNTQAIWTRYPDLFHKKMAHKANRSLKSSYIVWPLLCILFIVSIYYREK